MLCNQGVIENPICLMKNHISVVLFNNKCSYEKKDQFQTNYELNIELVVWKCTIVLMVK